MAQWSRQALRAPIVDGSSPWSGEDKKLFSKSQTCGWSGLNSHDFFVANFQQIASN